MICETLQTTPDSSRVTIGPDSGLGGGGFERLLSDGHLFGCPWVSIRGVSGAGSRHGVDCVVSMAPQALQLSAIAVVVGHTHCLWWMESRDRLRFMANTSLLR
jgi:hypothetical protein